ncbi:hypothetical protein HOG48_01475 [Candidatus Peregrinibacteria bacterium]|jgi:hypothetical protein|nr:hypothetical protein [Candidatus Peregrinibacteria bacterium]
MLDVSPEIRDELWRRDHSERNLDLLFHTRACLPDDLITEELGYDGSLENLFAEIRAKWQEFVTKCPVNQIDFHGQDREPYSELYRAFLLGHGLLFSNLGGIRIPPNINFSLDAIFGQFSTIQEVIDFATMDPLPDGWITSVWHDRARTTELIGPPEMTRVLLDLDDTLFFKPDGPGYVLRPNTLEWIRSLKALGAKVGFYTDSSRTLVHNKFNCITNPDSGDNYTLRTWDKDGRPIVLGLDEAAEELAEIAAAVDFAVTRYAYQTFHPLRAISADTEVLSDLMGDRRPLPAHIQSGQHYAINHAKILPGYGLRNILLDNLNRTIAYVLKAYDFSAYGSSTVVQSPTENTFPTHIEAARKARQKQFGSTARAPWTNTELDYLAPLLLQNNKFMLDAVRTVMAMPEERLQQRNIGMPECITPARTRARLTR